MLIIPNAILNVLGNVMIPNVLLFVILSVNHPDATLPARNPEMLSVMSNVKNQNVKSNVLIKPVKLKIAPNVLQSARLLIVSLIAKHPNQNVRQFVRNPNVIGNAINQNAPSQNVSWSVKIQPANLKWIAVPVNLELLDRSLNSQCSRKMKLIHHAAHVEENNDQSYEYLDNRSKTAHLLILLSWHL